MIVLDTHALLWFDGGDNRLGRNARRTIANGISQGEIAVSAISIWEVGMLIDKQRIDLRLGLGGWRETLNNQGLIELPVSGYIAERAATLQNIHGDPADRIIIATALEHQALVTADRRILNWEGELDRIRATD